MDLERQKQLSIYAISSAIDAAKQVGITQEQIATHLGVAQPLISFFNTGTREPKLSQFLAICAMSGTEPGDHLKAPTEVIIAGQKYRLVS